MRRSRAVEPRLLLTQRRQERELLVRALVGARRPGEVLRVLEAGCGQKWPLKVPDVPIHITGVDVDAEAMRLRREIQCDLDVAIVGDLRTVELAADTFDVAYCAFVLEHVEGAQKVLDGLVRSVRPGGRVILLVPDGGSVVGWAAKTFPIQAAVFYKRYVEGFKQAGQPGHAPYPTVYDDVVSLDGMRRYAERSGLTVVDEYGIDYVLQNFGRFKAVARVALRVAQLLSGGRLSSTHNNLGFVLEKPSRQIDLTGSVVEQVARG